MTGFNFDLYQRNQAFTAQSQDRPPKATSTGTTIVGLIYADGVILGADTRATDGAVVADKNCDKIHYLAPFMYCCGAGTAGDTEFTTNMVRSTLHLQGIESGRTPRVLSAMTMLKQKLFNYGGYIEAALILGGIDPSGTHLFTIHPHGSTDKLPFTTMGSGSLAAMAVFEAHYRPNLSKQEGIQLVTDAIQAGIFNDLGSGSNVDVVVISKTEGTQILRNIVKPNERVPKLQKYNQFPKGTAIVIKEEVVRFASNTEMEVV